MLATLRGSTLDPGTQASILIGVGVPRVALQLFWLRGASVCATACCKQRNKRGESEYADMCLQVMHVLPEEGTTSPLPSNPLLS